MKTAVSIVMPAWNAAATIAVAVDSVRAQTFGAWELIIVDDGSTDDTAAVAERAAAEDTRVRLVGTEHQGIIGALNTGISVARAPLIARMDSDDVMHPGRLAAQVGFLDRHPEIGVVSCLVEFGGDRRGAQGYALHVDWINSLHRVEDIALARFIESPVAHPSVVFRRELIERHGSYAESGFPEDYELWLRWMEAGVRFAKVPEVLVRWNDRPGRLSRTDPRYAAEAFFACKCRYLGRWLRATVAPGRHLLLWGAGRVTRKRFAGLVDPDMPITGYIDVDPRKVGTRVGGVPVIGIETIPAPASCFVVGAVGTRGAREWHRSLLLDRGFVEGRDFIFAA